MSANVGSTDRVLRLVLGIALIVVPLMTAWSVWASPAMQYGAIAVGAVLVLTALFRFCPLYRLIGMRTCRIDG